MKFLHEKKNVKYICNNSYTRVFIRPRTVTKLRTLGQLRHRSVASLDHLGPVFNKCLDVSLCESIHRTSACFRCYLSNQKLHDSNQQEHPHLFT